MLKKFLVMPLSFAFLLGACSDDNLDATQEVSYRATSLTCDGSAESLASSMILTITFSGTVSDAFTSI